MRIESSFYRKDKISNTVMNSKRKLLFLTKSVYFIVGVIVGMIYEIILLANRI